MSINKADIWMPYHIKDMRSETYNMSRIERSVYVDLLCIFWEREGDVPCDDSWIASELGLELKEWLAMRGRVLRPFSVSDGALIHTRFANELTKAKSNIAQKRAAGIASAEARKDKQGGNARSTPVERALNGRTNGKATGAPTAKQRRGNGEATAGQPRAGGGKKPLPGNNLRGVTLRKEPVDFCETGGEG